VTVPFRREALAAVADAAGALARDGAAAERLDVAQKADGSPVTAVDAAVDAFLKRELSRLLPASGWLSEETVDDKAQRLGRDFVWIVDPIDGTKQLVSGIPEIAVSIGLVASGSVVASAVVNPMTGESGTWVTGTEPAYTGLDARPVPATLAEASAVVSRTETEVGVLSGLESLVGSSRPVGSVAYKLLRVAAGADALTYSVLPKNEWDVCGGVGLLEASGRTYLRLDGNPVVFTQPDAVSPSGAVAGPRPLAEALRRVLVSRLGGAVRRR
jgi:myo-inositol-1(or 4)-monophosphatase